MKVYVSGDYDKVKKTVAEIVHNSPKSVDDRIKIFCEDKFTMAIERSIAKKCGGGFNHEVSSFNLYMKGKTGDRKILSSRSSAVVVKSILIKKQDELSLYDKSVGSSIAPEIYELIAQLKSAKITPDDVLNASCSVIGTLSAKLKDLYAVYKGYEDYLFEHSLLDGNNYLALMPKFIEDDDGIKNTTVILAGYPSVTKQSAEIFKSLVKNAKEVIFVVVGGENGDLYLNETLKFINGLGEKIEYLNYDFDKVPEVEILRKNLYKPELPVTPYQTDKIKVYKAYDQTDELKRVCKEISVLVKDKGLRYRNTSVIVGNLADYDLFIRSIFDEYDIPYFIDVQKKLSEQPIIKFFKKVVDAVLKNGETESVFQMIGDGLFDKDKESTDNFVTYCCKYAITRKTLKQEFTDEDENTSLAESVRQKVNKVLNGIPKNASVRGFVKAFKDVFTELKVEENQTTFAQKLAEMNEYEKSAVSEQAYGKFTELLDETEFVMQDDYLSLKEFAEVICSGADACDVSIIPQYQDSVYIGDFTSAKYVSTEYVFACGLDGNVPRVKDDTAILTDGDLIRLDDLSVVIEPKIQIVNRRQKEAVCLSLTSFTDTLHLSYCVTDLKGKPSSVSPVIGEVERLFYNGADGKFSEYSERILKEMYETFTVDKTNKNSINDYVAQKYIAKTPAIKQFIKDAHDYRTHRINGFDGGSAYYVAMGSTEEGKDKLDETLKGLDKKVVVNLQTEGSEQLYFNGNEVSVTTLEDYFSCPYKCYLKHGLKLKDDEDGTVKANEYGTLIHEILEKFVKYVKDNGINLDALTVEKVVGEIFDKTVKDAKYSRFNKKEEYRVAFDMLKKELTRTANEILYTYKKGKFLPLGAEVKFGYGGKFKAINLKAGGNDYKVRGVVDRADVYGKYLRIVDYKSGSIKDGDTPFYDESLLYVGKKLQLYLYMNAFTENGEYEPVGVYYSGVNDAFSENGLDDVNSKLSGKTVYSGEVLQSSDGSLGEEQPKSNVLNIEFKYKDGEVVSTKNCVTKDEMKGYLKYAKKVSEKAVEGISSGFVMATPYKDSCTYCKYKGVCGYDENYKNRTREVKKVDSLVIQKAGGED